MTVPWEGEIGPELPLTERAFLRDLAHATEEFFGQTTMVNIGVFRCATMYCLRAGASKARIVGVDIRPARAAIHPELKAEFIIEDSRTCHRGFEGPIHMLFIDGDHSYAVVAADIANWTTKVVVGGVVAFHDYSPLPTHLVRTPALEGVKRAVSEGMVEPKWSRLATVESIAAFRRVQ